ncbi:steroid delta-isomerase [Bacillus sp. FJAT-18017]|uniref:nuclear transport factor 2 family protein n=1 Tax=Bacillus sp. FJAT-18017 TaxID=1705566 RepID=UPI0006AFFC9C|nr:nuclear transport factor 2 family protein [Bacillus sp. FJAT-18017]ALC89276.1 steroid delta-isomerase [Bacillus sp. FJAT-18017]
MARPEELAQQQLDAYNKQDIDAFVSVYSKDVVVRNFPSNQVSLFGIEQFRERYANLFQTNPNQRAELKSRIVKGNIVIDHEYVTGRANGEAVEEAIAIYEVSEDKILNVWFVK